MKAKAHLYILMSLDAFTSPLQSAPSPWLGAVWQESCPSSVQVKPSPSCTEWTEKCCSKNICVPRDIRSSILESQRVTEWEGDEEPGPQLSLPVPSWWWHHVQMAQGCPDPPLAHCMSQGYHSIWTTEPWTCGKDVLMEAWMRCENLFFPFSIPLVLSALLHTALKS